MKHKALKFNALGGPGELCHRRLSFAALGGVTPEG